MIRTIARSASAAALALLLVAAAPPPAAAQSTAAQPTVSFEEMVADLGNADAETRLRAVQALKQAAFAEAAVPLAALVTDPEDAIQYEAIAAELNIFLAEPIVPRKRVGLVIELRKTISASSIFDQGPEAIDPRPVPVEVLTALRTATHDDTPRVAVEAFYAFGALSDNAYGRDRQALLAASSSELASALASPQPEVRAAAVRVISRLYAWRVGDDAVNQTIGDAMVGALNDTNYEIRRAAMSALGALRYDRAVQPLTDLYQHFQRGANAAAALSALARIAHPNSVPLFIAALNGRDRSLRIPAIEGIARSGDVSQEAAIMALLVSERDQDVLFAGQFASAVLSNTAMDGVIDGLTRPRLHDRALVYLTDAASGRVGLISPHLQDPDARVRIDLLTALGLSGDPQALPIVEPMIQDSDAAVSRAATRATARLRGADTRHP